MNAPDCYAYRMRALFTRQQIDSPSWDDPAQSGGYCLDAPEMIPAGFCFSTQSGYQPASVFRMDTHKETA